MKPIIFWSLRSFNNDLVAYRFVFEDSYVCFNATTGASRELLFTDSVNRASTIAMYRFDPEHWNEMPR